MRPILSSLNDLTLANWEALTGNFDFPFLWDFLCKFWMTLSNEEVIRLALFHDNEIVTRNWLSKKLGISLEAAQKYISFLCANLSKEN